LRFNNVNVRRIYNGAMAAAIGISLSIGALAQDSPGLRMPRRAFEGRIDIRNANIVDAAAAANPNTEQGPGPGPIGPGPGCNLFPAPPSVGATVDLS
jgi:hypothetical protein